MNNVFLSINGEYHIRIMIRKKMTELKSEGKQLCHFLVLLYSSIRVYLKVAPYGDNSFLL